MSLTTRRGGRARQKSQQEIVADMVRRGVPYFTVGPRGRPAVEGQRMLPARKPAGTMFVNDQPAADALQCKHCGGQFFLSRDTKRRSGWCMNCAGPTCPRPECDPCTPFMAKIEAAESAKQRRQLRPF